MANKHGIGPKLLKNWWRKLQVFQIWIKSRCQLWKSSVWKFKGPETSTGMFKGRVTLDDSLSGEGDLFSSMNRVFWLRSAGRLNKRLPMLSASTSAFVAQLRAKKKLDWQRSLKIFWIVPLFGGQEAILWWQVRTQEELDITAFDSWASRSQWREKSRRSSHTRLSTAITHPLFDTLNHSSC